MIVLIIVRLILSVIILSLVGLSIFQDDYYYTDTIIIVFSMLMFVSAIEEFKRDGKKVRAWLYIILSITLATLVLVA